MPLIQCHLDDDVVRRLSVFARMNDREPNELAASWITEAARKAIPCALGIPVDSEHRLLWDAPEPSTRALVQRPEQTV